MTDQLPMKIENDDTETNNEPLNENVTEIPKTKTTSKIIRFFHSRNGLPCHAWDMLYDDFLKWKTPGTIPKASWIINPDGSHPLPATQPICGTCKSPITTAPKELETRVFIEKFM